MEDSEKIKAHFGHVVRRGNRVNIKIRLAPDENRDRTVMRVSINTETGKIVGDVKGILAFVQHIQLPLMGSRGLLFSPDGERIASAEEVERAQTDIANAINTVEFYTASAEKFVGEVDAGELVNELKRVFSELENE